MCATAALRQPASRAAGLPAWRGPGTPVLGLGIGKALLGHVFRLSDAKTEAARFYSRYGITANPRPGSSRIGQSARPFSFPAASAQYLRRALARVTSAPAQFGPSTPLWWGGR